MGALCCCFSGLAPAFGVSSQPPDSSSTAQAKSPKARLCGACGRLVEEFARGARMTLCRECLRKEDEALLEPLEPEERRCLAILSGVLDDTPWTYWKPGEQPARLLEWLYLGDLKEAMDFESLRCRGIRAVLNLIDWWELAAFLPDDTDVSALYAMEGIEFLGVDSEDRLFFALVEKSWPEAEAFMKSCRDQQQCVMVNCKAGHNRSACVCVCWLMVHEGMSLLEAVDYVQTRRGTILSNHGFRLQLVRLALKLGRFGEEADLEAGLARKTSQASQGPAAAEGKGAGRIIAKKRLGAKYDSNPDQPGLSVGGGSICGIQVPNSRLIPRDMADNLSQRTLKLELMACLYHQGRTVRSNYDYTSNPPTIIGSGWSGDVVLCRRRQKTEVQTNMDDTRCVKTFDLNKMGPDRLDKLVNEAVIYLSLEHPHIARLFDVYEDEGEVSLVMQYCQGGTLEDAIQTRGCFGESAFLEVAVSMLLALNYIHQSGIVHRDIKPRNWVLEADGVTVKLIDFGFSVKGHLGVEGLKGCMGTLGYLAPEVVRSSSQEKAVYTEKCDIWSVGVVFFEMLAGYCAFHREQGMCDGYTQEVVLREIVDVTPVAIEQRLSDVSKISAEFLRDLLTISPEIRPSAHAALNHSVMKPARSALMSPTNVLPVDVVLERFRAYSECSRTTRSWLLAVARSPTYLPWQEFCKLRDTFKMFDAIDLNGYVSLDAFLSVVIASFNPGAMDDLREEVRTMWNKVCGRQESLSYCEFLAVLLPPIEDVFEDVGSAYESVLSPGVPSPRTAGESLDLSQPISNILPLLQRHKHKTVPIFDESLRVMDAVRSMSETHHRWGIVKYWNGRREFFDYMDINCQLVKLSGHQASTGSKKKLRPSALMARISMMAVGEVTASSRHSSFVPMSADTPLLNILRIIAEGGQSGVPVRRVPIVDSSGEMLTVFSSLDFLDMALQFAGPTAVLKSRAARTFDRRDTMLDISVSYDDAVLEALRIMDSEHCTICPATSRDLCGDLGGVVVRSVLSVSDLKWVLNLRHFSILDEHVSDFIAWRNNASRNLDSWVRSQRLNRFNVVSVHAGDSLHELAQRLVESQLQRIFLSSEEIARIVGIVSSRDILLEVLDQLL